MCDFNQGRLRQQVSFLRRQFLQEGDLAFADILSQKTIAPALEAIGDTQQTSVARGFAMPAALQAEAAVMPYLKKRSFDRAR